MAFQELIKNFERTRAYARDFLIYGIKSRQDMDRKSARTYDNEKRRVEAMLPQFIQSQSGPKGKQVYLCINPEGIEENPLYALLESRSFTQNDVLLHFFLLDLLQPQVEMSLTELSDALWQDYWQHLPHISFPDLMTIRNKVNEFVKLGLLCAEKQGRQLIYKRHALSMDAFSDKEQLELSHALQFWSANAPLGVLGHWIRENIKRIKRPESPYCFRHLFLFHALDELILYDVVEAIRQKSLVLICHESTKRRKTVEKKGIPLKVSTNLWHGRRFVHFVSPSGKTHFTCRLDLITSIKPIDSSHDNSTLDTYSNAYAKSWSIIPQLKKELEWLEMTLKLRGAHEDFLIERLRREGQYGTITQIDELTYLYRVEVTDLNELAPWLRTWLGRIAELNSSNAKFLENFRSDCRHMRRLYNLPEEDELS